ncbi:MAG: glycosyltransferase family 4 protein, partial [Cyanobacteria bacterium P01_A01_bin.68]
PFVGSYFHLKVRRFLKNKYKTPSEVIIHFIAPISPVVQRYPSRHFLNVIGPVSGNIYHPPAFQSRQRAMPKFKASVHERTQRLLRFFNSNKRADKILVSGGDRTVKSLVTAGFSESDFAKVYDSGVNDIRPSAYISGHKKKGRFIWIGRLIEYKAADIAVRATALAQEGVTLDIVGDGPLREELEGLVNNLKLENRVCFRGWIENKRLVADLPNYEGFVFPTLAEANGIVMQEAMMASLPVITLRWGGPAAIADDSMAIFIDPTNEDQVIKEIATSMNDLTANPEKGERLGKAAREHALKHYSWDTVAQSWLDAYPE